LGKTTVSAIESGSITVSGICGSFGSALSDGFASSCPPPDACASGPNSTIPIIIAKSDLKRQFLNAFGFLAGSVMNSLLSARY
jgi:hypothetical protein